MKAIHSVQFGPLMILCFFVMPAPLSIMVNYAIIFILTISILAISVNLFGFECGSVAFAKWQN